MPFGAVVQKRTPTLFAGRLRHRITLVTPSSTQDSAGGLNLSANVPFATVWASVEALQGTEKYAADEQVSQVTHQVVVRYIGEAASWFGGKSYAGGRTVKDSNGNIQQAQGSGGTSGADAPTWNATLNGTTTDNTITWKNLGPALKRTGVTATMQVQFGVRQFQIESVMLPDERKKFLVLMCIEINDSANQTTGT